MMVQGQPVSSKVRVGVVGAGWWATTAHLPALHSDDRVELVGVADVDEERARQTAERFSIGLATTSHQELLSAGIDAIVVATPHDAHFEAARDALLAGTDVLIEKPMVIDVEEGRELVALRTTHGRRLDVGYPFLYTRHVRELRQAIANGALGEIVLATGLFATPMLAFYGGNVEESKDTRPETLWATNGSTWATSSRGGGQLLSQLTHSASLLLYLTGLRPTSLFGAMHNGDFDVDVCDVIAFTIAGAAGTVTSTGTVGDVHARMEEYRIFGASGQAELSTSAGLLSINHYASGRRTEEPPLAESEIYPIYGPARRLVDGVLDPSLSDTADLGLLTVEVLAAARLSAETASAVRIPPAAGELRDQSGVPSPRAS
jgi:predicted dehydrogenase